MTVEDCAVVREGFPRPFPTTPSKVLEQFWLHGKVVVVTGAADGIGLAVADAWQKPVRTSRYGTTRTFKARSLGIYSRSHVLVTMPPCNDPTSWLGTTM